MDHNEDIPAFELLNPKIQEQLYKMRWEELHPIQVDAIKEVILGNNHIVISSRTAGGKTEAAFLPILSKLIDRKESGIGAVYVGPLKALINDQFMRLEELCRRTEIAVHKWHGDVTASKKRALLKNPSGVLLITPESIESIFINKSQHLHKFFSNLPYIVIDELHSFIGTERGAHLQSLLARINQVNKKQPKLIGLSATLGDVELAGKWMCKPVEGCAISISDASETKTVHYLVQGYLRIKEKLTKLGHNEYANHEGTGNAADMNLTEDIIKSFANRTSLIFGNSKSYLEEKADLVNRIMQRRKLPNSFGIHHGSLGKIQREETEEELKSNRPISVFCSSTLEMGIDVGDVSIVGQLGPPWSVNSLIQRLGRSGRKDDDPQVMRVFIEELEARDSSSILQRLHRGLLQTVAMSELMLQKWCEPPEIDRLHLSTMVHQILSIIAEKGGTYANQLFESLIARGTFSNVDKKSYKSVLKSLGEKDVIEQTPEKLLILGLNGERIVRNFEFYAAFKTPEEFSVIHREKTIGTIVPDPSLEIGSYLILAARRWQVTDIIPKRKQVFVMPAKGKKLPIFGGGLGPDVHPFVRMKMYDMLFDDNVPRYLNQKAAELLLASRVSANEAMLDVEQFIKEGKDTIWFTWTGSRINRTLMALGSYFSGMNVDDEGIALVFKGVSESEIKAAYKSFLHQHPTRFEIAMKFPVLDFEKFDELLSKELTAKAFAKNYLNLSGALEVIKKL
ncbi:MAG: DEAD/DEAH box helicase [Planctomycetota bacterium]|nr:MAG: DEAD/DEAH box helicase [Planctomycetota bacterium]